MARLLRPEVAAHVANDLGLGIAMLRSVLDPTVVVLGGYFAPLGELVLGVTLLVLRRAGWPPGRRR